MRTTPLLATAWAGAATAAVGLGFFAVGLLDADPVPASAATALPTAAVTPSTSSPSTTSSSPQVTPPAALTGQYVTDGGTVYGSCVGGELQLGSAPAPGWEVDDSSTAGAVELKGGDRRIHVTATCGPGGPVFSVAEGGDDDGSDDRGGDDDRPAVTPAPSTRPAPTTATTTAEVTPDDHGGRGSDDSGSDDSSGRGSGGHGSDDSGSDDSGSGGHGSDD
ncbi:hypothetical protein [Klenkia brasiliensis]|uniref:Uncharacterized protein n=1 Tax=Klenkia brasiliensis TaxID=333142 RepID=A0A1G7THC2_9ACTN|nr:hypothetical protein [Klenkia brasiliensis]SDG34414.1 hypothetical protein SAMN05660324_2471 [Klenkia brasiliensis]